MLGNKITVKIKGSYIVPVAEDDETLVFRDSDNMCSCYKGEIVDKLGAYESTGLDPKEITELKVRKDNLEYKVSQLEEQIKWMTKFR